MVRRSSAWRTSDQTGFPPLLWKVVCDLLGSPVRPRYVVFESPISFARSEFRADVHIRPCLLGTNQPYLIQGRSMPTVEMAIQFAAWESLVRLRCLEPIVVESRAFHFFPSRPRQSAKTIGTSVRGETDPAVCNLVAYGAAMTMFSESLLNEFATTRRDMGLARAKLYIGSGPPTLTRKQARSQGLPFPDPGPFRPTPGKDLDRKSVV